MIRRISGTLGPLITFLVSVAVATLFDPSLAIGQRGKTLIPLEPTPTLRFDLSQLAYSEVPIVYAEKTSASGIQMAFGDYGDPRPVFTDKKTLAIVYERLDPAPNKIVIGQAPPKGQLHLKALFVDSSSGRLLWRGDWPTMPLRFIRGHEDTQSSIFALHHGRFLVQANTSLKLYSPNFEILQERELPFTNAGSLSGANSSSGNTFYLASIGDTWVTHIAPGGRIALLNHIEGTSITHEWIDVDTLQMVHTSKSDDQFEGRTASETAVADLYRRDIIIRSASGDSRILCDSSVCGYAFPLFLTSDAILAYGDLPRDNEETKREGFIVLSTSGKVLWSKSEYFKCSYVDGILPSLDGDRFVLLLHRCRGEKMFDGNEIKWRDGEALLVYDRKTQNTVLTVQIMLKYIGTFRAALSPDGSTLAVLMGTDLSIYELPPSTKSIQ